MSGRKILLSTMLLITLLLCDTGCIPIEDLGEYWSQGTVDPQLEGDWKHTGEFNNPGQFLSFVKYEDRYDLRNINAIGPFDPNQTPAIHSKTLTFGKHNFLIFDVEHYFEDYTKILTRNAAEYAEQMGLDINDPNFQKNMLPKRPPFKACLQRYTVENGILSFYLIDYEKLNKQIKNSKLTGTTRQPDEEMPPSIDKRT